MEEKKSMSKTGWNFDNSYTSLPQSFFSLMNPTPVSSPRLVIFNYPLAKALGLNEQAFDKEELLSVFAGNQIPEGALPIAQAYAGHQFGHFTMLGDGRAVLLGEQLTPAGERLDIQLKGSGRTPYSRGGDGRAALGPMLREYIISEAMYALGIPTTRSLAVVTTGETIFRDNILQGAILTRIAASHIRVGTFEYAKQWGHSNELQVLADYTIERHFPNFADAENKYISFLKEVIKRQASLIAKWQLVGFIHGVMNTDNMTISGETIDYGPCAFMDTYNPATVFSSIDRHGRYAYSNQPLIGAWNLARLAETLLPLFHDSQEEAIRIAQDAVQDFNELYQYHWITGMRAKLGLFNEEDEDKLLSEDLLTIMHKYEADYTNTFRALTLNKLEDIRLFAAAEFTEWHNRWQERLRRQKESIDLSRRLMEDSNPAIIPRNHLVEAALEGAERGEYSLLEKLLGVLSRPYDHTAHKKEYCEVPPSSSVPYRTFCGT